MKSLNETIKKKPWVGWLLFLATFAIVFLLGLAAASIMERRTEDTFVYKPRVQHDQFEPRNEVWGRNFPREAESYARTERSDFKSKYNGSAMIDMLEVDPRLVILWAGYGFSKDYNQGRGHHYAVEDVHRSLRTGAPIDGKSSPMPSTCWTCKSPDVPRLMNELGVAEFYQGKWEKHGSQVVNSIGCADCHDANTMELKLTRPALVEALERMGKDMNKITHNEMRSLVCAQCHSEYYFNKKKVKGTPYLTFPWDNGLTAEAMEEYYDNMEFTDWTHKLSRAPMLKAQHPGYETYLTGIHAKRGVSCADCHMPFISEGGQKFTDHHIQSPLNNVANSCQVCHREEASELIADVYERQDKIIENRDELEKLLVRAHVEAKFAWDKGANEEQMKPILQDIRHAQWRWDYAAAAHGGSFHTPLEIGRTISSGLTVVQEGRLKLARLLASLGHREEVPYPDISTKEKAQKYIGLDVEKMKAEKSRFLNEVLPVWLAEAAKREAGYPIKTVN